MIINIRHVAIGLALMNSLAMIAAERTDEKKLSNVLDPQEWQKNRATAFTMLTGLSEKNYNIKLPGQIMDRTIAAVSLLSNDLSDIQVKAIQLLTKREYNSLSSSDQKEIRKKAAANLMGDSMHGDDAAYFLDALRRILKS